MKDDWDRRSNRERGGNKPLSSSKSVGKKSEICISGDDGMRGITKAEIKLCGKKNPVHF